MRKAKIINIPNFLSAYRIVALPFIIWAIVQGNKNTFITLLSINLVTDILDGLIARSFKLETEFGARLDSIADIGTYIMALTGMLVLEREFVKAHAFAFSLLFGLYILAYVICLVRFKRTPSLHLYSCKITGYLQGIFIFSYFVFGADGFFFYLMIAFSCVAYIEEILLVSLMPELRSNVKGIYFIIRDFKRIQ